MKLRVLFFSILCCGTADLCAQPPFLVADQTFRLDEKSEHAYAFAEGDELRLYVEELSRKSIRSVEFVQYPDQLLFSAYKLDTALQQTIIIPQTGVYLLRIRESGFNKKICRFTLHRTPAAGTTGRLDTRVPWDIQQVKEYVIRKRSIESGKKTELVSMQGQVSVTAGKFGAKRPVNAWQFALPPFTKQWAYRISVGQATQIARQQDAQRLTQAIQNGSVKIMGIHPETALAAFALGAAIDLTVPRGEEDVEYAMVDWANWEKFSQGEPYTSVIQQGLVSADVQRRYNPTEGSYLFAFKNDNWLDDITVSIEIECVTEVPQYVTETYLEAIRP
jgi:hypothetical protein